MRTDLLIAGALAAVVVGGVVYVAKTSGHRLLGTYDATASSELYLRSTPVHEDNPFAIVPPGEAVRVDTTNAPGWVYVYWTNENGVALEGYAREENLSGLSNSLPINSKRAFT